MQLCSVRKKMNCIFRGDPLFLALQVPALSSYVLSLVWSLEETEIMTALVLVMPFPCDHIHVQSMLPGLGRRPSLLLLHFEWLKFLLSVGLIHLHGKFNSKPVSESELTWFLKDFWVFGQASSSICFGGCCQTPEGWVGRCCCFLLIVLSK